MNIPLTVFFYARQFSRDLRRKWFSAKIHPMADLQQKYKGFKNPTPRTLHEFFMQGPPGYGKIRDLVVSYYGYHEKNIYENLHIIYNNFQDLFCYFVTRIGESGRKYFVNLY